jgi:hypothetical protein
VFIVTLYVNKIKYSTLLSDIFLTVSLPLQNENLSAAYFNSNNFTRHFGSIRSNNRRYTIHTPRHKFTQ